MKNLLLILAISFSSIVLGQDQNTDNPTVYVTETGTRYHQEDCRYLKYSKIETTKTKARADAYTPCKVCYRSAAASSQNTKTYKATSSRCSATTQKGTRCKRSTDSGTSYCWQHQ